MPRHALALANPAGKRPAADGPRVAEGLVSSVRGGEAPHTVAFHDAGEAAALAGAGHVDEVSGLEQRGDGHLLPYVERLQLRSPKLLQHAKRPFARARAVATLRLRAPLGLLLTVAELHGGVAVALRALPLHDGARPGLNDRHRGPRPVPAKDLRHAEFRPDQPYHRTAPTA